MKMKLPSIKIKGGTKTIKIVAIVLVVIAIIAVIVTMKLSYDRKIDNLMATNNQQNELINNLGDLVTVYETVGDIKAGKAIEESDLQPVDIPSTLANNMITSLDEVKSCYFKIDLSANTKLSKDLIMQDKLDDSARLLDVVTDENPLGLTEGTYVDIRIAMPLGEDFIAMTHKRVKAINSGVLKLVVNEGDIHTYNSMLVDRILYPGTRIYATEYVEPGVQTKAQEYYPVASNIGSIAVSDPNKGVDNINQESLNRRKQLEISLSGVMDESVQDMLAEGKKSITTLLEQSNEKLQEKLKEEANKQAIENGTDNSAGKSPGTDY